MLDYNEKRRFMRMDAECEVTFTVGDGKTYTGITHNLSGSGIQFETEYPPTDDTEIEISVKPGTGITPPLRAIAKVIRSSPSDNGSMVCANFEKLLQ